MNEKGKVLLVDDDESVLRTLTRTLTSEGYRCETAHDGEEALRTLRAGDFDVVLTDLKMPKMDGIALLESLPQTDADAVPVVLTGYGEVSNAVTAMKLGAFDFLEKPCDGQALLCVVERAVKYHQILQEVQKMAAAIEEWEVLFDAWPDFIMVLDQDKRILRCNQALTRRLGKEKGDLIGQLFHESFCFDEHPPDHCPVTRLPAPRWRSGIEFFHRHWGIQLEFSSVPLRDSHGKPLGSLYIARDITERKQAEARLLAYQKQLQSLASELSLTEERERRNIAASLHDGIGQTLAISMIKLDELRESAFPARLTPQIDEIRGFVEQAIEATRLLTFDLSPRILYELGLEAAVESLLEQTQAHHAIATHFVGDGERKHLDDDIRILLFRAIRELLINIAKYAKANNIHVALSKEGDNVQATVTDDGAGFDTAILLPQANSTPLGGFGLFHIREQLKYLHGSFEIESVPGRGTRVTLTAPLKGGGAEGQVKGR